jgi:hypothetical protein
MANSAKHKGVLIELIKKDHVKGPKKYIPIKEVDGYAPVKDGAC